MRRVSGVLPGHTPGPASHSLLYLCGSFVGVVGAEGSAKGTGPAAAPDQHQGSEMGNQEAGPSPYVSLPDGVPSTQ